MKTTVRAKFNLHATKTENGDMIVTGHAVTNGCEENKTFSEFTPAGNFSMTISKDKPAQESFVVGETREYYLDITPVIVLENPVVTTSENN